MTEFRGGRWRDQAYDADTIAGRTKSQGLV